MKQLSLLISSIFLTLTLLGQDDTTCYALRVIHKNYLNDASLLSPKPYLEGFYVLKNGVYDFEINGDDFNHQRVLEITRDSIFAAYAFDTVASLKFWIGDTICIRLNTCHDGRCKFPNYKKTKGKKYQFNIVPAGKYCTLESIQTRESPGSGIKYPGFQYLSGAGLIPVYRKNGVDFVIEGSVTHVIRKP